MCPHDGTLGKAHPLALPHLVPFNVRTTGYSESHQVSLSLVEETPVPEALQCVYRYFFAKDAVMR